MNSFTRLRAVAVIAITFIAAGCFAELPRDYLSAPVVSRITPVSFDVGWAMYPAADETTHYQTRIGNFLYGASLKEFSTTVRGLIPGRTMEIYLLTYHQGRLIGVSSPTSVLTGPEAPSAVSAFDIATTALSIRWQPVSTATSYAVYRLPGTLLATVPASSTQVRIGGFQPGERIGIVITAINPSSSSFPSASITVQLLPASPAIMVEATEIGQTAFNISWSQVPGAATYSVFLGTAIYGAVASNVSRLTVTGCIPGTTVTTQVRAENESGLSELSTPPVKILLLPPTPMAPVAGDIAPRSVRLSWLPVSGADGFKIWRDREWLVSNVPSSVVTVPLYSGINPGDIATYTVSAWNATGDSPQSPGVLVQFPSALATRMNGRTPGSFRGDNNSKEYMDADIYESGIPALSALACADAHASGWGLMLGNLIMTVFTETSERVETEQVKKESKQFDLLHRR